MGDNRSVKIDQKIRDAENRLFTRYGIHPDESFLELAAANVQLRVLSLGSGPPLVLLHGVSLASAVWTPWANTLAGYRIHLVDLPGHGLSGPVTYEAGTVRTHSVDLLDELFDALKLEKTAVIGHSLGGMFSLWHVASTSGRIASLIVIGDPAVALPGVCIRMPLSPMTVPILGPTMLRIPLSRPMYRQFLGQGLSPRAAANAPDELIDTLRFAAHRPGNASTVASLMHSINRFRHPRPASVMSRDELDRISVGPLFCWGADDPFLTPDQARPSIETIPSATLRVVPGGHGPWLDSPEACSELVIKHLTNTGFAPAS